MCRDKINRCNITKTVVSLEFVCVCLEESIFLYHSKLDEICIINTVNNINRYYEAKLKLQICVYEDKRHLFDF